MLCDSLILSLFAYGAPVYHACLDSCDQQRIQRVQNSCLRYVYGIRKYDHISHKLKDARWLNMFNRRRVQSLCLYHKVLNLKVPRYLQELIQYRTDVHNLNTRFRGRLSPPLHRLALFQRSFEYQIYRLYNSIDVTLKELPLKGFKSRLAEDVLVEQCVGGRGG